MRLIRDRGGDAVKVQALLSSREQVIGATIPPDERNVCERHGH